MDQHPALNYDVLLEIGAVATGLTVSALMQTCRRLYHDCAQYLLTGVVRLKSEKTVVDFCRFVEADGYSRCSYVREMECKTYELSPASSQQFLEVIPRLTRLESLRLPAAEDTLASEPSLVVAFASLTSLRHLDLFWVHGHTMDLLANMRSSLKSLTITFLSVWPHEDSIFWDNIKDDVWLNCHPVPFLRQHMSSLQKLHMCIWHTFPQYETILVRGYPQLPAYPQVYPNMRSLEIERCNFALCLPYIRGFPNLMHLSMKTDHAWDLDATDSRDTARTLRNHRAENVRSQMDSRTTWEHLEDFTGTVVDLYMFGLVCPIPRVELTDRLERKSCNLPLLADVLSYAQPVHLKLEGDGTLLSDPASETLALPDLLRTRGGSRMENLDVTFRLDKSDEDLDVGAALEYFAASLEGTPLRRLSLKLWERFSTRPCLHPVPPDLAIPHPASSSALAPRRMAEISLDALDVEAYAQRISDAIPSLDDMSIRIARPRKYGDRAATYTKGGVVTATTRKT
ncbi:hypothetical protein L227DRAFT_531975 [Lentinus tigrinus ALCF2SS1-6]|uniref:F-box domain-containing protein n=1 Tax=Lentinus tigrinus ALCF2SS1-6 TaxID=1328759 RepID=A0A5C2RZN0_9APHY|nr:hypothetical protein L227DRAFT_531975 [Lentinus tigrinus ALCF2SS1-6]